MAIAKWIGGFLGWILTGSVLGGLAGFCIGSMIDSASEGPLTMEQMDSLDITDTPATVEKAQAVTIMTTVTASTATALPRTTPSTATVTPSFSPCWYLPATSSRPMVG